MLCPELEQLLCRIPDSRKTVIQELRLRCDKPIALTSGSETLFISRDGGIIYSPGARAVTATKHHIYESFRSICGYSVYSRQNEITEGFITASDGSRIGLCGTAAVKNGEIASVTDITSLNIRVSRQVYGVADKLINSLFPLESGILIAGPPSSGKTTLLRDIARSASLGLECRIMRVCVIDERCELSGGNKGNIDLGLSDVMCGYPRSEGIIQAVRSLSPQLIICDEVGTDSDAGAVAKGANAGAFIIASIHAGNACELARRSQTKRLLDTGAFGSIVILENTDRPGTIKEIIRI